MSPVTCHVGASRPRHVTTASPTVGQSDGDITAHHGRRRRNEPRPTRRGAYRFSLQAIGLRRLNPTAPESNISEPTRMRTPKHKLTSPTVPTRQEARAGATCRRKCFPDATRPLHLSLVGLLIASPAGWLWTLASGRRATRLTFSEAGVPGLTQSCYAGRRLHSRPVDVGAPAARRTPIRCQITGDLITHVTYILVNNTQHQVQMTYSPELFDINSIAF